MKRLFLAAAAAAALCLGSAVPAMAADNANGATLYAGNFQCGGATSLDHPQGFVNAHQDGAQLTLIIHIKDALPNTTYEGFLYDEFCTPDNGSVISKVKTNSNGVANDTVTVTVRPGQSYFLTVFDADSFSTATAMQTQAITP